MSSFCLHASPEELASQIHAESRFRHLIVHILVFIDRGVQYVHCVMHKCIMVKEVGGNEIHIEYAKTRKFPENRGNL